VAENRDEHDVVDAKHDLHSCQRQQGQQVFNGEYLNHNGGSNVSRICAGRSCRDSCSLSSKGMSCMGFLIAIIFNGGGRLCQPALAQLPHLQQRIVGGWKSLEVKSKYVRAAVIADVV